MIRWLLMLAAVVLLAALGCAGADWFINGHKSLVVALAGFAGACYLAAGLNRPPTKPPRSK